jgi:hypothetical protein
MRNMLLFLFIFSLLHIPSLLAEHKKIVFSGKHVSNQVQVVVCPNCNFQNAYGAHKCGHCRFVFVVENTGISCHHCSFINAEGASFCSSCGQSLIVIEEEEVYVTCPYCHRRHIASTKCGCSHSQEEIIYDNHHTTTVIPRPLRVRVAPQGPILLDTFHKNDFQKERKEYNISRHTQGCSFSKLLIEVNVREEFAVILNSVQVRVNGHWQETTIGSRLYGGQNQIPVNIPEGATGLVCSFTHGRGSDVSVFIG